MDHIEPKFLSQIRRGIEKESLRVSPDGNLSTLTHPIALGSPLTHSNITTDFSEAQLELITDTHQNLEACLQQLKDVHHFVYQNLGPELLWCSSMPCSLPRDDLIPIATYGSSNIAKAKTTYRRGLAVRYGRTMQTISGIHYNFSLPSEYWTDTDEDLNTEKIRRNEAYFGLIRNFRRYAWLLLYLFGASPAVCQCFVEGRVHQLKALSKNTRYLPYATSLRMGPLGYQSDVQSSISVSYNNLGDYSSSLFDALTKPFPPYSAIGLKNRDGEYQQLSTSLLQIENEFYGTIRPKQPVQLGERPLHALNSRGVEYVEVRCIDIDPYSPIGINEETSAFIDTFLLYCMLSLSPKDTPEENKTNGRNQYLIAERGREPGIKLIRGNEYIAMKDWGKEIIDRCVPLAEQLDYANKTTRHTSAIESAREKLNIPNATPSGKILHELQEKFNGSYFDFVMDLSSKYASDAHNKERCIEPHTDLQLDAQMSLERQRQIESTDQISFDEFRATYISQEASRIYLTQKN